MASPTPEIVGTKRKRSPIDDAVTRPVPPAVHAGNVTQINYLAKAKHERLRLIEGDVDTFGDVLSIIDDYEGVLQRHESLAANLGAKLVGPLLLKSFEKLFDGPIKVTQTSFALEQAPITWLDIVSFARTNLSDFVLNDSALGKACRIWIKGGQIEISEDDYRLIMSGAPERMIPIQPIPEDESSELGTLNILETRLGMLIRKADAVASKARQLNYHLKGRKTAVLARKAELPGAVPEAVSNDGRNFSPQPFSAINNRSPKPSNGETSKLQQDLLEQFLANDRRNSVAHTPRPKAGRIPASETVFHNGFNGGGDGRRMSHSIPSSDDGIEGQLRVLMAAKIEKIARGDLISPPCDRCRRLRFDCTKHLTACSACTKKHAKCSWKDVKEGELDTSLQVIGDSSFAGGGGEGDLDPGLRSPGHSSGVAGLNEEIEQRLGIQGIIDLTAERRGISNEHAILTQIASAAAAAGPR